MFAAIFLLFTILNVQEVYTTSWCFTDMESEALRIPIDIYGLLYWSPKNIYIVIEEYDTLRTDQPLRRISFDAKLVAGTCENSAMILPNTMKRPGEQREIFVSIFYGKEAFLLDQIKVLLKYGFPTIKSTVGGSKDVLKMGLKFDSSVTDFSRLHPVGHTYFRRMDRLKEWETYCLMQVSKYGTIILKLDGKDIKEKGAWDHYVFDIEAYKDSALEHTERLLFQTYVCSKWDRPDNVKVIVNKGTTQLTITGRTESGHLVFKKLYVPTQPFSIFVAITDPKTTIENLEVIEASMEDALKDPGAIRMFKPTEGRIWCKDRDDVSYIKVFQIGDHIIRQESCIAEHLDADGKITQFVPGSEEAVMECQAHNPLQKL